MYEVHQLGKEGTTSKRMWKPKKIDYIDFYLDVFLVPLYMAFLFH